MIVATHNAAITLPGDSRSSARRDRCHHDTSWHRVMFICSPRELSRRKYARAEAVITGGGGATTHSVAGRDRRDSASTAIRRHARLSDAVLSETLRIVGVEIGVTLSKSIAWPARREQLVR